MPAKTVEPKPPANAVMDDWRDATFQRLRELIQAADPRITEERKWIKPTNPQGVTLWSRVGRICTGEKYKDSWDASRDF